MYTAGSTWMLTKVNFDTRAKPEHVSNPLKMVINLQASVMTADKALDAKLPKMFTPAWTLSRTLGIVSSNVLFDVLGLIRSCTEPTSFNAREKALVELTDLSEVTDTGLRLRSYGLVFGRTRACLESFRTAAT